MALTQQVLGKLGCPAMGLTFLMTVLPGIDDLQRGNTACGTAMLAIGTVSLLSFISAKAKQLQYADTLAKMTCTAQPPRNFGKKASQSQMNAYSAMVRLSIGLSWTGGCMNTHLISRTRYFNPFTQPVVFLPGI